MNRGKIKILLISIFILLAIMGTAFAENDIATLVNEWYSKKVTIAKTAINQAVQTELVIQKDRIEEEMRARINEAARELDNFTEEEKEVRRQALIDYADNLIANMEISNEEDKAQIQSKLNQILFSAQAAMDNLVDSYMPPTPIYESPVVGAIPVELGTEEEIEEPINVEIIEESEDIQPIEEIELEEKTSDIEENRDLR